MKNKKTKNLNDAKARAFVRFYEYLLRERELFASGLMILVSDSVQRERLLREYADKMMEFLKEEKEKEEMGAKIKVTKKPALLVEYDTDKPYYNIMYYEVGKDDYTIGFGSYRFDLCMKWMEEEFEIVEDNKESVEDVVGEPAHYKHGTFQTIDEMVIAFGIEKTITFCQLNAWKYRARAPYKNNMQQDMDKANKYLEMAYELQQIRQEYPEANGYEVCALLKGREEK